MMRALAAADPRLVAINLSRNHGHQLALTAGPRPLLGRAHPDHRRRPPGPARAAPRDDRRDGRGRAPTSSMRCAARGPARPPSSAAPPSSSTALLSRLAEIEIPLDTGDFRLMSRRALDALLSLPEQARFIRGMVAWVGFRQVPIAYDRAERHAGESKYPLVEDDALRARRGHRLLDRAAAHGQPYRPVAGRRLGAAARLYRASASSPAARSRAGPR